MKQRNGYKQIRESKRRRRWRERKGKKLLRRREMHVHAKLVVVLPAKQGLVGLDMIGVRYIGCVQSATVFPW